MTFKQIKYLDKFQKDLKKLQKRFHSLNQDVESFIKAQLVIYHKYGIDNHGIVPIQGLQITHPKIYKARKFACKALKGKGASSGIRIIYAYFNDEDRIEFIEIYYKGDQENEDRDRIKCYYQQPG